MKVTTVGIDLAKNVFQLHGINEYGKTVISRPLKMNFSGATNYRKS